MGAPFATAFCCCSVDRAQPDTLPNPQDNAEKKSGKAKKKKGKDGKEDKADKGKRTVGWKQDDESDAKEEKSGPAEVKNGKETGKTEKRTEKTDEATEKRTASKKTSDGKPGKAKPNAENTSSERAEQEEVDKKDVDGKKPSDEFVGKFHSALRWGKSRNEVQALVKDADVSKGAAARAPDPKTGNQALHISVQNGHRELTEMLISWKADVTSQNFKGQTPLHMSVEYDFYFISKLLLEKGAKREVENADGCKAILGMSGGKEGAEAWDAPTNILKNASNKEELNEALEALESDPSSLDKASLARVGMLKAKEMKEAWDKPRFMEILNKVN